MADTNNKVASKPAEGKFDFNAWVKAHVGEFKRIVWPSRQELTRETITVVVVSLVLGILIMGVDFVFQYGLNTLTQLFS